MVQYDILQAIFNKLQSKCQNKIASKGSWFDGIKLTMQQAILILYFWVYKYTQMQLRHELKIGSKHTSVDWYNFVREVCAKILISESEQIGGIGVTVEIDESMFCGRRKYNRGQIRNQIWVFGAVESHDKSKCFLVPVLRRNRATLLPIIRRWIKPGTTIISDFWGAYNCLQYQGFQHLRVNHQYNFVDPDTGAHTNTIEGTWSHAKRILPRTGTSSELLGSYLIEFMYRREYFNNLPNEDKFLILVNHIARIYDSSNE